MPAQNSKIPPHFLVIVPGWMGSNLQAADKMVWGNFFHTMRNPLQWRTQLDSLFQAMTYPNPELKPAGILDEVVFVPPWGKLQTYGRLLKALHDMGYKVDPQDNKANTRTAYTFAYDWRQDNRISADQLGRAIEHWRSNHPGAQTWIIAHSNGGLVARWYIEKLGGKDYVSKLFLMGAPSDGTPIALQALMEGLAILIRKIFNRYGCHERSRDLLRTFPSLYQLLPYSDPFLRTTDNDPLDVFDGNSWLESKYHLLLEDGRRFNEDLGTTLSVETFCFYGVQHLTPTVALVSFADEIRWDNIKWIETGVGDGTIPRRSAIHSNARQVLPYIANHGSIYVAKDVLEKLKYELIDQYRPARRSVLSTPRLIITLVPNKDIYSPGEEIVLQITILTNEENPQPVSKAKVEVNLMWEQALPGSDPAMQTPIVLNKRIWETKGTPGHYGDKLTAPRIEGYYRLEAIVQVKGEATLTLEELIAVEDDV